MINFVFSGPFTFYVFLQSLQSRLYFVIDRPLFVVVLLDLTLVRLQTHKF